MRGIVLIALIALAASNLIGQQTMTQCFTQAKLFESNFKTAIEQKDIEKIIDSIQSLAEELPKLLDTCGAQGLAEDYREQLPASCLKVLARQAKLFVKIMRLSAQDKDSNQKAILVYLAAFQTIYKTQAQKKCPFLKEHDMLEVINKGECAEGAYRLSLTFEQMDHDLLLGKFNDSLTDLGKVIEYLPYFFEDCNQQKIADLIKQDLPEQCRNSLGALVREIVTIEHHYSHLEWLKKHLKDFTKSIVKVRDTCPILARK